VPIDIVTTYLELDTPGPGHPRTAEKAARHAAAAAEQIPLPEVACQAWQLLGALLRGQAPYEATACLERIRAIAKQHDLPIWETHALVRLGTDEAYRTGSLDGIEHARREASRIGAITARYQAEAGLSLQLILRGEFDAAQELIDQIFAATTRLKLVEITQLMLIHKAVLAGHRGLRRDMESAIAELHNWKGDLAQYAPRVHGLAKVFCALLTENRTLAIHEMSATLRADEASPTTFQLSGRYGLHLLLGALSGDVDTQDYETITAQAPAHLLWDRVFSLFAHAVLSGRNGYPAEANAAIHAAIRTAAPFPMARHLGLRLASEAALTDGWGEPTEWLSAAENYFRTANIPAVADACRQLRLSNGIRTNTQDIPGHTWSTGITVREYEALQLLRQQLHNREIADQLRVSQRTVDPLTGAAALQI
jgi:hypothetical protein